MGITLNAVEHLGAPFAVVDEQVFMIPHDRFNEIANTSFKIIFMLQGNCLHQVDDEAAVPFCNGDVLIIPRECRQRYWVDRTQQSHRVHALRLVLDPRVIPTYPSGHRRTNVPGDIQTDFAVFIRHHLQDVRHLALGQDSTIRRLLADLREEAERRPTGFRFRATALCTALVVQIVRQLTAADHQSASPAEKGRARLVNQTKEYLLKNHARELHLSEVARYLTVTPEHLSRLFKQETGQTVFQYLQHLRLEKSKTLLLSSDLTVSEIARQTGFSSVSLFSRNFRHYVGSSPQKYRKQRWSEAIENNTFE